MSDYENSKIKAKIRQANRLPAPLELRDYFAAAALTGMLSSGEYRNIELAVTAADAYRYADEMLKAREQ
jgi:hypothetical protein